MGFARFESEWARAAEVAFVADLIRAWKEVNVFYCGSVCKGFTALVGGLMKVGTCCLGGPPLELDLIKVDEVD